MHGINDVNVGGKKRIRKSFNEIFKLGSCKIK